MENVGQHLSKIIQHHVDTSTRNWLDERLKFIVDDRSTKDLYLTYSLIASKIKPTAYNGSPTSESDIDHYLRIQKANIQQITRIYLLVRVLESRPEFFTSKVANIIQVADTGELVTFLKFLILLPNPESYKIPAVDALRTNISTVFNAIAYNNPYPSQFFNNQQWNQMYLKTAFMQGDLSAILDVDKRANQELSRIISDYAHERWAATRDIDPYFWRPVSKFLDDTLLADMKRLLNSDDPKENSAGALCCYYSKNRQAKKLLENHQELSAQIENNKISWEKLKE